MRRRSRSARDVLAQHGLHELLAPSAGEALRQWKYDWEKPYVATREDFIFRNTFGDIDRIYRAARRRTAPSSSTNATTSATSTLPTVVDHGLVQAAGLHPDDLRHPRRDRRRSRQPAVHEADRGPAVRRRLSTGRCLPPAATDAVRHPGRAARRQRPRRTGGQPVHRARPPGDVNAEQVAKIRAHPGRIRTEPATPDEARQMLGLKGGDMVGF